MNEVDQLLEVVLIELIVGRKRHNCDLRVAGSKVKCCFCGTPPPFETSFQLRKIVHVGGVMRVDRKMEPQPPFGMLPVVSYLSDNAISEPTIRRDAHNASVPLVGNPHSYFADIRTGKWLASAQMHPLQSWYVRGHPTYLFDTELSGASIQSVTDEAMSAPHITNVSREVRQLGEPML
jgi:hypothetical protein